MNDENWDEPFDTWPLNGERIEPEFIVPPQHWTVDGDWLVREANARMD